MSRLRPLADHCSAVPPFRTRDALGTERLPPTLRAIYRATNLGWGRATLFRDGLAEQSTGYGHALRQSGPPQMPTVMFEDDPKGEKGMAFCTHVLKNGVYLHPWHNIFLSIAHTEADIEQALTATARAFQALGQLKIARLPTLMGREGRDATLE